MQIELKHVKIRDICQDYVNSQEEGVTGYAGRLDIRPKYQREFVYKDAQRASVLETVRKNFPLNVMYWIKNSDDSFEVLDGQQRTISICEYIDGKFSLNFQYFHNLEPSEQDQILDYELMIYFCEGTDKEKLDWFKTINIAGEKLTDQELRNAIYTGTWLTDAKRYFSQTNCAAQKIAGDYMRGSPIRQDYLETVLAWINNGNIEDYMAKNQQKPNANELRLYFNQVIDWTKVVFANYRKEMKGVNFGELYNEFKNQYFDSDALEKEIAKLMQDEDVTKKSGIYHYVLTRKDRHLSLRIFTDKQKREAYEKQCGKCPITGELCQMDEMEADHIIPWSKGGKTISDNCQMVKKSANREKSDK